MDLHDLDDLAGVLSAAEAHAAAQSVAVPRIRTRDPRPAVMGVRHHQSEHTAVVPGGFRRTRLPRRIRRPDGRPFRLGTEPHAVSAPTVGVLACWRREEQILARVRRAEVHEARPVQRDDRRPAGILRHHGRLVVPARLAPRRGGGMVAAADAGGSDDPHRADPGPQPNHRRREAFHFAPCAAASARMR